jgi:hypothetical protein
MAIFLDTLGYSDIAIAICDRCKMKRPYSDMRADGNINAIKVCSESCSDEFDPYRLPARQSEKITIRFPRPDADIAETHNNIILDPDIQNKDDVGIATEQANTPNDGNLDILSP